MAFNKKEWRKKYYQEHKAQSKKSSKKYYQEHRIQFSESMKKYVQNHRSQINAYQKTYYHKYYPLIKNAVLDHYSNGTFQCALCGGNKNLSIDHINFHGTEHRQQLRLNSSMQFYLWLRKNNFPDGYRVLCRLCNSKTQPEHYRKGVSPSRLVLNYFRSDNTPCTFRGIVTDLTPYATSERAVVMAIQRLYKNGNLIRIERGLYKRRTPPSGIIPEPKHPTGYKPHEVVSILGFKSRSLLLQWEKRGLITPPKRRPSGYRDYSKEDVLKLIQFSETVCPAQGLRIANP